jgi:gentisate 1,2-dioxygenase
MNYINPLTGSSAMPTITTAMQLLPKGFSTIPYRSTAGTVFSVVEGGGSVRIGEEKFPLEAKDLFVAPSWFPIEFEAESDLVIFSYSDRIVQEKLDLFREERGNA